MHLGLKASKRVCLCQALISTSILIPRRPAANTEVSWDSIFLSSWIIGEHSSVVGGREQDTNGPQPGPAIPALPFSLSNQLRQTFLTSLSPYQFAHFPLLVSKLDPCPPWIASAPDPFQRHGLHPYRRGPSAEEHLSEGNRTGRSGSCRVS